MAWETLKLFWRLTWRYKWLLIISEIGATVFTLCIEIFPPIILSKVVDLLATNPTALEFSDFSNLIYIFIFLRVLALIANRAVMQTYIRLEPNVVRDLENLAFNKLQGHSLAFFADNFSGALVAKVNRLTSAYQRVIEGVLGELGELVRRYIASIVIIFFLSPPIAFFFSLWTLLFCSSLVYLHRRKLTYSKAAAAAQTNVTARLADIITNTLTIRSFSRTKQESKYFQELTQERRDLRFRSFFVGDFIRIYKGVTIAFLHVVVLVLSIQAAINGILSVGAIVLIEVYLFQLINQLWNFGRLVDRIEESLADASEMTEIIMQPHEVVDPPDPEEPRISEGAIEFKNVFFQYSDSRTEDLFENFNLTIPAGQKVGLVGHSGGGKTTLTKLLLRFMDINSGEILVDGQNISNLRQETLRAEIAYVPQEPLLFHRTVFENIAYGNADASPDQVFEAAKRAHAAEFIDELPNKYDTIVGERGVKLSGGQRQRVAIARAMLKEAPIIILDEATSSLDSVSEKLITEALDKLMEKRTTLVIAHRLSTIRKLDRIIVLQEGEVVEDGTHEELLEKNGVYAELWGHQSGNFIDDDSVN